jgi:hypothetical protein
MEKSSLKIIVIDDHLKETDPLLVHLKLNFQDAQIILKNNAMDGLNYIFNNLNNKMIVLLDYELGAGETATHFFSEIREKTSLLYVIIITAKLINDIPCNELATYINKDAIAIIDKTVSLVDRMNCVKKAVHSLDARVDSILEQWILNHSDDEQNTPYLTTASGQTYTLKNILTEIRQGTDFGKDMERKILLLAIDLLTRGKKQIDD